MILIATPTYNNEVGAGFMASVFETIQCLHRARLQVTTAQSAGTQIFEQRNQFATMVLRDKRITHLLFADADQSWRGEAIIKMVNADKPIIGCIIPSRRFDPIKLMEAARREPDNKRAFAMGIEFFAPPGADLSQPISKVPSIGGGLTLIKREVFESIAAHPSFAPFKDAKLVPFFDHLNRQAEDVSFCERWKTLCGGEIFAVTDEPVGHMASFEIKAAYTDRF